MSFVDITILYVLSNFPFFTEWRRARERQRAPASVPSVVIDLTNDGDSDAGNWNILIYFSFYLYTYI